MRRRTSASVSPRQSSRDRIRWSMRSEAASPDACADFAATFGVELDFVVDVRATFLLVALFDWRSAIFTPRNDGLQIVALLV